jgi:hypothetical protein
MQDLMPSCPIAIVDVPPRGTVQTTLYDVMATLNDEIRPELVMPVVLYLLHCGKISFPVGWGEFFMSLSTN